MSQIDPVQRRLLATEDTVTERNKHYSCSIIFRISSEQIPPPWIPGE